MPEHTDTSKEKILVYIRAEKQKTLHRRQVCINDIASVYCKYSRYEGQIKGMIVDKIRGKKSVISVMKIIEQLTEIFTRSADNEEARIKYQELINALVNE